MREIRTSGLMSGDRKRDAFCTLAPVLDSTQKWPAERGDSHAEALLDGISAARPPLQMLAV